jgi:tetratricopeptide (TPR) repeat protein
MQYLRLALLALAAGVQLESAAVVAASPTVAQQASAAGDVSIQDTLRRISAIISSRGGHLNEAIAELRGILAVTPGSVEAHLLLGLAYRAEGSPVLMAEAKAEFQQALDLNPDFVPARLYLAETYLWFARPKQARDQLEAALTTAPRQPRLLALLADTERRLGNPERAVELSRQALAADPSFLQARYHAGLALLDLNQRDEGIRELEHVAQSGAPVPDVYLSLGFAYLEAGRSQEALAALVQGSRLAPERPDLRLQLARAYRSNGLLTEAEEQLNLARPTGNAAAANAHDQQMESDLHLERGLLKQQQGQLDAAVAALRRSLEMDATQSRAHRHLAEIYLQLGMAALASDHAAQAEQLGSPLPDALRQSVDEALRAPAAEVPR